METMFTWEIIAPREFLAKKRSTLNLLMGKLSLNNILYVPSLRRNLISGALLNKADLKLVFEADMIVISKNRYFVGKVYLSERLFVLNVLNNNESTSSFAYIVKPMDV